MVLAGCLSNAQGRMGGQDGYLPNSGRDTIRLCKDAELIFIEAYQSGINFH